jgi:WG containing repeat
MATAFNPEGNMISRTRLPTRPGSILIAVVSAICSLCAAVTFAQPSPADRLFVVQKDGKSGFIDRTGKIVIPITFDSANDFHEGLALVMMNGKKMFIDAAGKIIFNADYDIVNDFSERLAAVNIGQTRIANIGLIANPGKWGYIDKAGKLVIPMTFTHAENFSEGLAAVTNGDRNRGAFIDHNGKVIFNLALDVTLGFHEGIAGVLLNGSVTYYDRSGKKLDVPTEAGPRSHSFSEGLVPIQINGKNGFMDKSGKVAIAPQFEDVEDFSEGVAAVKVRGNDTIWCARDASGSRQGFTMKWGFIDKAGKFVIPAQFESATSFSEGLAVIQQCGEAFFIDKTGKTILKGDFKYASSFVGGLARVERETADGWMTGYIDRVGKVVWLSKKEGYARAEKASSPQPQGYGLEFYCDVACFY